MKRNKKLNWHTIIRTVSYATMVASASIAPAVIIAKRDVGMMYVKAVNKEGSQDLQWLHNKLLQSGLYAQVRHAEQMAKLKSNIEGLEKRIADYPEAEDINKGQDFLAQARKLGAKYYVEPEAGSNERLSFNL